MPLQDRQPEPIDPASLHPVEVVRPGGLEDGIAATSPGVLLSPGALFPPAPVPAPARGVAYLHRVGMLLGRQGAIEVAPMTVARTPVQTDEGLDAARALALDARRIGRLLSDSARLPMRWRQPAFGVEVERVRRRLARIRSHDALASSYGREIFENAVPRPDRAAGSAARVAYALRWLELQDGVTGPSWPAMID